jgi:small conductance mechanosensitive channel
MIANGKNLQSQTEGGAPGLFASAVAFIDNKRNVSLKIVMGMLQVILLVCISSGSMAQPEGEAESLRLEELIQQLDGDIEEVRALSAQLESVPERDQEAVMYRRDQRGFSLLQEIHDLARRTAQLSEEDPLRQQLTRRLREDLAGVTDVVFQRTLELGQRIAKLNGELDSLSGASRLGPEAYVYSLENLRVQSYQATVDVIEGRRALGLPVDDSLSRLQQQLYLHAETLVGRLEYSGEARKSLQARLDSDPQNTELAAAMKSFSSIHTEDLQRLEAISQLIARLQLDNTDYKALLLQQGQAISVRDFESALVLKLLQEGWVNLKETLVERAPDLLFNLLIFILVLFVFRILSRLARRAVNAACERSNADMSTLLKDVLSSVIGGTVMVVGIMMALAQVGISLGPILAGLGVAGFVVGFALQDTLGNFAAGGMILLYRPYDVDDFIEVTGASGLVKKMSLVSTTITTFDNQTLVVPNSKIWGDVIKNVTAQNVRRVDLNFGIGYGDDIEQAERVLLDIITSHALVLKSPEPLIKLHTLGDSSVNFVVRPWVKTGDYWTVYWDVTREVKIRFDQEGISIPFPQQDVHIYQHPV